MFVEKKENPGKLVVLPVLRAFYENNWITREKRLNWTTSCGPVKKEQKE